MYKKKKISLVLPVYNEEKAVGLVIDDFESLKIFDEIIVVDNNCRDASAHIALKRGAKIVKEAKQGFGFALRKGMAVSRGDYIFLCDADGTYDPKDAFRLLENLKENDYVFGTRVNKEFIGDSAYMGSALRFGNIVLGKIIQVLFNTSKITDCGCTYRVMKKSVVKDILPHLKVGGGHFIPESLIVTTLHGYKIKEVPVHYRARIGQSKLTGSIFRSFKIAIKMFQIAIEYRFTPAYTKEDF